MILRCYHYHLCIKHQGKRNFPESIRGFLPCCFTFWNVFCMPSGFPWHWRKLEYGINPSALVMQAFRGHGSSAYCCGIKFRPFSISTLAFVIFLAKRSGRILLKLIKIFYYLVRHSPNWKAIWFPAIFHHHLWAHRMIDVHRAHTAGVSSMEY